MIQTMKKDSASRATWLFAGLGVLLLCWWILSRIFDEIIIASPAKTIISLAEMMTTWAFWKSVGITFQRFATSLMLGSLLGFTFGVAAGLCGAIRWILEPFRWILMTIPPAVLVVISMIWFGMGSIQTVFVTSLLILPIVYINTVAGIDAVDEQLIEMAAIYHAQPVMLIRDLYIGYEFALSRTNLDTPALFAWVMVCLVIGGGLEICFLTPLKKYIMRWREDD